MSSRIGAVIFDMDGLLIDTERVALEAYMDAGRQLGIETTVDLFTTFVGRSWATTKILLEDALGPDDAARMLLAWPTAFDARLRTTGIPKKPGVDELLGLVRRRRIPIALATSTDRDRASAHLDSAGLIEHFPTMAAGDEVVHGKPAPDIFLLAAQRLRVDPETCIVLEDSEPGVRAASAARMRVVMVPDLKQPEPGVAALAERICASLFEAGEFLATILPAR
jgi:HAD superfamily hydrolase (TIGR01509 family)